MADALEQQALSVALEAAIGDGRVRTAVFVTYQFDPRFFEAHVLPLLFARGFSPHTNVRAAQLDDCLRQDIDQVAVYYDRAGLGRTGGPPRLDYQRVGVSLRGGVLHAKNVITRD